MGKHKPAQTANTMGRVIGAEDYCTRKRETTWPVAPGPDLTWKSICPESAWKANPR